MTISDAVLPSETEVVGPCESAGLRLNCLELLTQVFGVEFSILDGVSGEMLYTAPGQPEWDWNARAELCREVARRNRPEFIDEEDPFIVLALPLAAGEETCRVAVATFVTRPVRLDENLARVAGMLNPGSEEAVYWANRQIPWTPELLRRIAELAIRQLASTDRIDELVDESKGLSANLASTYEEISLLHRLTQNLKISEGDEQLGRMALDWLDEVVPAESIALYLLPVAEKGESLVHQARTEHVLITHGVCPIDEQQFGRLIDHLQLGAVSRPLVANRAVTREDSWPCPEIRQMIAVPLAEGDNLFGWLAAFNHADDAEFGTIEASLLNSVATILGIHGGNIELYRQQSELFAGIVRALTSAIDAKDPYTRGHSDRVARISVRLATELGCDQEIIDTIYLAGLLHDIGKIGIDDSVLRKPGKLSDEEYEHIKKHVQIGHRILVDLRRMDDVLPVVLYHHESWDGSGYPHRLPSKDIPLAARVVAVADAFDAMSSDRPYRTGMPDEKIDAIFRAGAGKQWDPAIVDALFRARDDIHQITHRNRDDIRAELQK